MNYDINIRGDDTDNGMIEFDRLNLLTEHTTDVATKALMLRIGGFSGINPTKEIRKALTIRLAKVEGSRLEGTSLLLNCDFFTETLRNVQFHLFRPTEEILQLTPMTLVIQSFRSALVDEEDKNYLDKPLLLSLSKFKKIFKSNNEVFRFSNRGATPEIEVVLDDFKKIDRLDERTPEPKKVLLHGKLDEMKYSKSKLVLITAEGPLNAFTERTQLFERVKDFFGKEVSIMGEAHYKPGGGLSFVEVHDVFEPGKTDRFFSHKPHAMGVQEQIALQLKSGKSKNPLAEITGKWPGDESLDELLGMID